MLSFQGCLSWLRPANMTNLALLKCKWFGVPAMSKKSFARIEQSDPVLVSHRLLEAGTQKTAEMLLRPAFLPIPSH